MASAAEYEQWLQSSVRYRVEINGGSQRGGKTKFFDDSSFCALFLASQPLAKGETMDVFVCRSLAVAIRPGDEVQRG